MKFLGDGGTLAPAQYPVKRRKSASVVLAPRLIFEGHGVPLRKNPQRSDIGFTADYDDVAIPRFERPVVKVVKQA